MSSPAVEGIRILFVWGFFEVILGDDLAEMIVGVVELVDGDVVVVTQKVVFKVEDWLVDLNLEVGHKLLVEVESVRVLWCRGDLVISETIYGFVCVNVGVDFFNVVKGTVALLFVFFDWLVRRIRDVFCYYVGVEVVVVVSDTFGCLWWRGVIDVVIGCLGLRFVIDLWGIIDVLG